MWIFAWPLMLLILPLPLLVRRFYPPSSETNESGLKVPSFVLFSTLINQSSIEQYMNWRLWFGVLAWCLLVLASARPERIGEEIEIPVSGRNLMLAVDLSGSMDAKDFELGGRRVDRLTATKAVASDFISRRKGDRIGLILFGEQAYLQVPLTLDRETVKILLLESFIGLAGEKTAIGDAITLAVKRIHDQQEETKNQVLVLLTDGANTAGEIEPLKAAELAQKIGLRIYTIGIGADQMVVSSLTGGLRRVNPSVDLDEETLIEIAKITGGRYFRAKDTSALQEIYRLLDNIEPVPEPEAGFRPVQAFFFWPLGASLLITIFLALMNLLKNGGLTRIREAIRS
jgi:Ca-activated chloride channel homolog